jgi:hypothetical protein
MRPIFLILCGLLALPAPAPAAAAADLKLATWDLGWLTSRATGDPALPSNVRGKTAEDLARLEGYAARLGADVVALQGVDDEATARLVFAPDRYALVIADDAVLQHTGFAIRRGLAFQRNPELTALDLYPGARLHLRAGADVTVTIGAVSLRLLSVHLKSGCRDAPFDTTIDRPACVTLQRQAAVLAGWVRERAAEAATGMPGGFAVLGDFGRIMDGPGDLASQIGGPTALLRATAGHASPCWGPGPFVDNLLIGGAAARWVQADSLRVMVYRETGADWRDRLSGHCPVSVRLSLPD